MKKKNKKALIALLIAVVCVGLLLLAAIIFSDSVGDTDSSLIRSETLYIVIFLMLLLPVTILAMIIIVCKRRKIRIQNYVNDLNASGQDDDSLISGEKKAEKEGKNRFSRLSEIDAANARGKQIHTEELSLKQLCEKFRNYSASRLKLYYSEADIRKFISGLAVTHIMIMQGMSGTGKTSLAYAFGEFLGNSSTIVPIQPMWKERTDLVGYYNEFTGKFNETTLLEKMYEANYGKGIYITVLDEMNIARVEYYFAEFLSLLEIPNEEGRYIDIISDKRAGDPKKLKDGRLKLPRNMWYIGTVNNDDSTFAISDKVYDRAMVMNLDSKAQEFNAADSDGVSIDIDEWEREVARAKREYGITRRSKEKIRNLDKYMVENYHITFGNRIMKQIKEYVPVYIACGGEETEAIDDIIMKKVLRKLESQNPVYIRKTIGKLIDEIEEIFGENKMPECKEYLSRLERTI